MNAFWLALQFLTRFPSPSVTPDDNTQLGRSALFYPLVGALIGLLLFSGAWLMNLFGSTEYSTIIAALMLTLWVIITGALHLDGLGDSADAWLGGGNGRQRCFDIMADPRSGTAAVVSIVLLLLLKFSALEALLSQQQFLPLLLAPIIGRGAALVLLVSTPNARPQGFGAEVSKHLPKKVAIAVALGSCLLVVILAPVIGSITLLVVGLFIYLLRRLMLQRLGGMTGDTCGAVIEVTEASVLLSWSLVGSQIF